MPFGTQQDLSKFPIYWMPSILHLALSPQIIACSLLLSYRHNTEHIDKSLWKNKKRGNRIKNLILLCTSLLLLISPSRPPVLVSQASYACILCFMALTYLLTLIIVWVFSVCSSNNIQFSVFRWTWITGQFKYMKLLMFSAKSGPYVLWVSICSLGFHTCQSSTFCIFLVH